MRAINQRIICRSKGRSGITLIELLVTMAILVVVLGMLFGIYDSSARMVRRGLLQDRVFAEAQMVCSAIERQLQQAVPASAGEWTANAIAFDRLAEESQEGPVRVRIHGSEVDGLRAVAMEVAEGEGPEPRRSLVGMEIGKIATYVVFDFAMDFDGLEPVWVKDIPDGAVPRLVRFSVMSTAPEAMQPRSAPVTPVKMAGAVSLVD